MKQLTSEWDNIFKSGERWILQKQPSTTEHRVIVVSNHCDSKQNRAAPTVEDRKLQSSGFHGSHFFSVLDLD